MLDAAVKALSQILSPPMRTILWRSIGLALVLITVLAIGLQRLLSWFADYGEGWAEAMLGPGFHSSLHVLSWIISIAAGLGVVLGGIFLMPAVTSLVASVFVDDVAEHVEREHYPAERPGDALPLGVAIPEGIKTALLTILVYLIALPFVLFAGAGFLIFFIATAWLLGREYFELAATRFRSPAEAKAMRKDNAATVFTAGLFIAAFVSIPIVNLATPPPRFRIRLNNPLASATSISGSAPRAMRVGGNRQNMIATPRTTCGQNISSKSAVRG